MARPTLPETAIPGVSKDHTRDHNTLVQAIEGIYEELDAVPDATTTGVDLITAVDAAAARAAIGAAAIGGTGLPPHIIVANATTYPGIDPTGAADSSTALTSALTAARGGTLIIPPGTYLVDARVTVTLDDGLDLVVIADGATFVCDVTSSSQGRMFRISNTVDTARSVTTVTQSITAANEYGFNNIPITTLACSTTPTEVSPGDYVRVVADDLVPGPAVGTNVRSGQTCSVVAVSGTNVIVSGHLRDPFTTNVRLARLSTAKLTWIGGRYTDSAAILAASVGCGELIEARLLIKPEFRDMSFTNVMGPAFGMRHSYAWRIDNPQFRWLHNQSSAAYGYGINDYGELGQATRVHAERVRHAYTTAAESTTTAAAIETYGRAYGSKISGIAHGTMAAAWDTHGDAMGIQFIDCDSYDCEAHSHLRGRYCVVRGGRVVGPHQQGVVNCDDTSSGDTSYGHDISGLTISGTTYRIFVVSNATDGPATIPTYIHDCVILDRDTTDYIIYADNSVVHHARIAVAAGGTRVGKTGTATIALMTEATDVA